MRLYHLRHSRTRGTPDVRRPRHFLIYRQENDVTIVLRLLHDAMDLPSHLAEDVYSPLTPPDNSTTAR